MDADAGFGGSLAETALPQVLRRIFLENRKGTLTVTRRDERRNLFFENGELRTAISSREGQRIGAFLKRRGWITEHDLAWALETVARQGRARLGRILVERGLVTRAVLDVEMRRLVEEIVFSTFEWEQGEYRFVSSSGVLDPDVVLALSTAAIIVEGIRRLPESDSFRERLGDGRRVPVLSSDPVSRFQYLPLTPQEAYLLSRVDGVADVESLVKTGGPSRGAAAKVLYALISCGLVEWKAGAAPTEPAGGLERLNVEVAAQPPDRQPGHADMVRNTYRRIDWLTHYELFGVAPDATSDQIRQAYFERARVFHPDLRHRADLASLDKELATVFDRLERAFETLADPARRAAYDAGLAKPPELAAEGRSDPRAVQELAEQNYRRAQQLIEEKDFHPAVEMLREAVRFVPDNAQYRFSLAQVELKNANWVDRGLENLKAAARLEPKNLNYLREAALRLHENARLAEAVLFARRAVQVDPGSANRQLLSTILLEAEKPAAVEAPPQPVEEPAPRRGLLRRLFRHGT